MTAKQVLLDWAESGGFAALHGGGATNEAIVEDLLLFIYGHDFALVPREPTLAMKEAAASMSIVCDEVWRIMVLEALSVLRVESIRPYLDYASKGKN